MNLDDILKRIRAGIGQTVHNVGSAVSNEIHQLPQQVYNVGKGVVNNVANRSIIDVAADPVSLLTPAPKTPIGPTVGQYARGQVIKPLQDIFKPRTSNLERAINAIQVGSNLTPVGNAFNFASGGLTGIARSLRTGQNLNQSVSEAIANPTSFAHEGLGIKGHPYLSAGIDILASGNPKTALKNIGTLKTAGQALHLIPKKNYIEKVADLEPQIKDVIVRYEKQFGAGRPAVGTPQMDVNLYTDAANIWKQLHGNNRNTPPPKEIGRIVGDIFQTYHGAKTEMEMRSAHAPVSNLVANEPPPNVGGGKPLSQVTNPTEPFYNVKRVGVAPEQQQQLKTFIEESGKELKAAGGNPLTHDEIIKAAQQSAKTTKRIISREDTLAVGAANLALRNQIGQMAKSGKVTPDFLKALQTDKAVSENLARLFGQRRITSDTEAPVMQRVLQEVLRRNQNTDEILKAAEGVDFNDANQAASFYRQFVKPRLGDYVDLVRYNSMLSSPITHIVNATSNFLNSGVVAPAEKTLTGTIDYLSSGITGKKQTQFASEGGAYLKGYYGNIGAAAHRFADVIRGKRESTNLDLNRLSPLHGQKGEAFFGLPTRMLEATDQFFTALAEGGEKGALGLRKSKGVSTGNIDIQASQNAAYRLFRSDLFDKRQGYALNAIDHATATLQHLRSLRGGDNSSKAVKGGAAIARTVASFTLPFVKTPMNILKQMLEYSPAGVLTIPGAANPTEQISKAILGTTGMTAAMMMLTSGRTTWAEPTDPKKRAAFRAAGMQPYAVKIGDNWISYSKLPPALSTPLAIVSALNSAYENKTIDQSKLDAVLNGIASVGAFFSDQSYLKNIGDAIAATKGSPENITQFVGNYPQQAIPYRAFMGWLTRLVDPNQRKVDTDASVLQQQVQNILKDIPFASGAVPERLDQNGEPIPNQNAGINAVSPLRVTTERPAAKEAYNLMQQKTMNTRNLNKAKDMILKGQNPDLSGIGEAQAAETTTDPAQALRNQAQDDVTKQQVKLKGGVKYLTNGDLVYRNAKGGVSTLSLTPPTKGEGIDAFSNADWQYGKAREVWKSDLPQQYKDEAFKKLGVKQDDVRYDYLAHHSTDESVKYIVSKNLSHDQLLQRLVTGRIVSISGTQFATNAVIDRLAGQDLLSKDEAKALKTLKLDKAGNNLTKAKGKGGGSSKKLASLLSKEHLSLSKLFASQVKNEKPQNARKLERVLASRRPTNTGLSSIQSILAKSEATAKPKRKTTIQQVVTK